MIKGTHRCRHSEETKTKISHALKGNKNGLGYRYTEEQRANLSRTKMGHFVSEETRAKLRQANLGKNHSAMKGNRYAFGYRWTEEQSVNLSKAKLGHIVTTETRAKISRRLTGNKNGLGNRSNTGRIIPQETRDKLSLAGRGRKDTEETKAKKSQVRIGMKFAEEHCLNIGRSKKVAWSNPEWRDKVVKAQRLGCCVHPNKAETALLELLECEYPSEWEFVGNGSLIIGGKNPDFWNGDHKLIEFYGNYWHKGEDPQDRIDLFEQYGFKTLVIWENELRCPDKVLKRVAGFTGRMED